MAGPLVTVLVGAFKGAVVLGGASALGAALTQIGVPKDQVIKYETAVKAEKYVLMLHGNADEVAKARTVLAGAGMVLAHFRMHRAGVGQNFTLL